MFRTINGTNPGQETLFQRFVILKLAENLLVLECQGAGLLGLDRLKRQRIVGWTILQHYEVCSTPLLDVTHSLRIAASFATHGAKSEAVLFVLGAPNLTGVVCPPSALRPHLQDGYLLGEYPEMGEISQKIHYAHFEIDFGRRLVAKFRFDPRTFWKGDTFHLVVASALYPSAKRDPLYELTLKVRKSLEGTRDPGARRWKL